MGDRVVVTSLFEKVVIIDEWIVGAWEGGSLFDFEKWVFDVCCSGEIGC